MTLTIRDVGEKRLIRELIRPIFNAKLDPFGPGDDCGAFAAGSDLIIASTDRVPADLRAFRAGIIGFRELGDYLARLNLSDVAACGGTPKALLLNLGLPKATLLKDLEELCLGFQAAAERSATQVLGGDLSESCELSMSATVIGSVPVGQFMRRSGARAGNVVFTLRPLGLTPAAFHFLCPHDSKVAPVSPDDRDRLSRQFTEMEPMVGAGRRLAESGVCTSCMDNTDGLGESLLELAWSSRCSIVVEKSCLSFPELVHSAADSIGVRVEEFAFGAGADFSLVGTAVSEDVLLDVLSPLGLEPFRIGRVEDGEGVWLESVDGKTDRFEVTGWNYFVT